MKKADLILERQRLLGALEVGIPELVHDNEGRWFNRTVFGYGRSKVVQHMRQPRPTPYLESPEPTSPCERLLGKQGCGRSRPVVSLQSIVLLASPGPTDSTSSHSCSQLEAVNGCHGFFRRATADKACTMLAAQGSARPSFHPGSSYKLSRA